MDDLAAKDAKNKKKLQSLMNAKGSGNDRCADCRAPQALWASVTLGVFLCEKCSHVHRKYLDAELSRIRSCETDTWTEPRLARMKAVGGNAKFNSSWEAKFKGSGRKRPDDSFTVFQRSQFITDKYMKKLFFAQQSEPEESGKEGSDSEPEKSPKPKSRHKKQAAVPTVTEQLEAWTLAPPPTGARAASDPLPKSKAAPATDFFFDDEPIKKAVTVAVHVAPAPAAEAGDDDFWGEPVSASRVRSNPPVSKPSAVSTDFFFDEEPTPAVASKTVPSLDLLFAPSQSISVSTPSSSSAFLDIFSGSQPVTPSSASVTPIASKNVQANMQTSSTGTGMFLGPYGGMMGGCIVNVGAPMEMNNMMYGMSPGGNGMYGMSPGGMNSMSGMGMAHVGVGGVASGPLSAKGPKPNIMDLFGP